MKLSILISASVVVLSTIYAAEGPDSSRAVAAERSAIILRNHVIELSADGLGL